MALRDQPYLPLFVQDFLTDEKLIECSAQANGVYIRYMCIAHKSEEYGKVLLKQKDKQSSEQIKNFALKLAKQMPYPVEVIEEGLEELIREAVLILEGDILLQKRMVKDNTVSSARSLAGKKGGKKTQQFASKFAKAKNEANTEYEYETEIESVNENNKGRKKKKFIPPTENEFVEYFVKNGYRAEVAKRAFAYYTEADWIDSLGHKVQSWKSKAQGIWFKPENLDGKKMERANCV